jgi:hypothetical protein
MPGPGAACLLVASFGPWGMLSASGASQAGRLMDRLAAAGALQDGRLARVPALGGPEIRELNSAIALLANIGQLDRLRPLFAGQPGDPFASARLGPEAREGLTTSVQEALHVARVPEARNPDGSFWHTFETAAAVPITGYDLFVPSLLWGITTQVVPLESGVLVLEIGPAGVAITGAGPRTEFPAHAVVGALAARLADIDRAAEGTGIPPFVELQAGDKRVGLLFNRAGGDIRGEVVSLQSGGVTLFLRRADWAS